MIVFVARMASGLLRSMLTYVLSDSTFTGVSERSKVALQQTDERLKKVSEETYVDSFDDFAVQLVTTLESLTGVCPMSWQPNEKGCGRRFTRRDQRSCLSCGSVFCTRLVMSLTHWYVRQLTRSFLKRSLKANSVCNQGNLPRLALLVMRSVLFDMPMAFCFDEKTLEKYLESFDFYHGMSW